MRRRASMSVISSGRTSAARLNSDWRTSFEKVSRARSSRLTHPSGRSAGKPCDRRLPRNGAGEDRPASARRRGHRRTRRLHCPAQPASRLPVPGESRTNPRDLVAASANRITQAPVSRQWSSCLARFGVRGLHHLILRRPERRSDRARRPCIARSRAAVQRAMDGAAFIGANTSSNASANATSRSVIVMGRPRSTSEVTPWVAIPQGTMPS